MNKSRNVFLLMILVINMIMLTGCSIKIQQPTEYPLPGRNTVEWFGNGRFEIFSGKSQLRGDYRYYCLYDRKDGNGALETEILVYKICNTNVYVIGLNGGDGRTEEEETYGESVLKLEEMPETIVYTKVNYESEEVWQSEDITDFGEEDQVIFEELLNSKTLHE